VNAPIGQALRYPRRPKQSAKSAVDAAAAGACAKLN
jgi:hypothetical protein